MYVSTPFGVFICVDEVYCACPMMLMRFNTLADFVILDIKKFDIIFRTSWLSSYYVVLS